MKPIRLGLMALALLAVVVSGTAQAATPASGTLSRKVRVVRWTGEFTLSQPNPLTLAGLSGGCLGEAEDPICDHFMLKVDLPDGARVRIEIPVNEPYTDIDFEVYAPNGAQVASSGNLPGESELAEFRHSGRFRNKPYEVRVAPYLVVPGTTYQATARVR
jgi:hypothetical protein